jgi:hypothetical protein
MTTKTDIPKDYQPVVRTIPERLQGAARVGYRREGEAEAATDSYRLHYEHDPILPIWRSLTDNRPVSEGTYTVDKALVDWLKVAVKMSGKDLPLRFERKALTVAGNVQADGFWWDECAARFKRPMPIPAKVGKRAGINPKFLLEALRYITRDKLTKPQTITVKAYDNGMFSLHNCTRHAYIMGMRLD